MTGVLQNSIHNRLIMYVSLLHFGGHISGKYWRPLDCPSPIIFAHNVTFCKIMYLLHFGGTISGKYWRLLD